MDEIFEPSLNDEIDRINSMMETIPEEEEPDQVKLEVKDKPVTKAKKGRKPLTDARKAQLKEQLARGRATSLAKRRNNSKLNKLKKAKAVVDQEDDIVLSTKTPAELRAELKALKAEMKQKQQIKKEPENIARAVRKEIKAPKEEATRPDSPIPAIVVAPPVVNTGPPAWLLKRKKNKYL